MPSFEHCERPGGLVTYLEACNDAGDGHYQPPIRESPRASSPHGAVLPGPGARPHLVAPQEQFPPVRWLPLGLPSWCCCSPWPVPGRPLRPLPLQRHMFQHVLLIYPVAFLWCWHTGLDVALPFSVNGAPLWLTSSHARRAFLTFHSVSTPAHAGLYEWALRDSKSIPRTCHVHARHAAVVAPGAPAQREATAALRRQLLYLIAGSVARCPSPHPGLQPRRFLPTYRDAPRVLDLSPVGSTTGAVIMKLTAMAVMFVAMTVIFMRWYHEELSGPGKAKKSPRLSSGFLTDWWSAMRARKAALLTSSRRGCARGLLVLFFGSIGDQGFVVSTIEAMEAAFCRALR